MYIYILKCTLCISTMAIYNNHLKSIYLVYLLINIYLLGHDKHNSCNYLNIIFILLLYRIIYKINKTV